MVEQILSGDVAQQVDATSRTRKLLSREENPPIQPVIGAGLVPYFVRFLASNDPQLQVSLASCIPTPTSYRPGPRPHCALHHEIPVFL